MTGPTVAVSGGGGYLGSVLVPRLLGAGYRVRVLDLFLFDRAALPSRPGLTVVTGDVRDAHVVGRWVRGADAVVHLAGVANDPSCELDPALAHSVNVAGAETVIAAARRAGVGLFVFASSASVYGIAGEAPSAETAPLAPITDYGTTKMLVEEQLRRAASVHFPVVTLRPAALYGLSARLRLDLTVNIFTCQAALTGQARVLGGRQRRPVLHVADASRLVEQVLARRWDSGRLELFNAAAENLSVSAIAHQVVERVNHHYGPGHATVCHLAAPPDDRRSYVIDAARARRELGFTPRLRIADAVDELCRAFDRGQVPDALTDDRYHNVRRVARLLTAPPGA